MLLLCVHATATFVLLEMLRMYHIPVAESRASSAIYVAV